MRSRRLMATAGVLACAVALGAAVAAPGPASAAHLGFACNGAGTLNIQDGSAPAWFINGTGRCDDLALPAGEPRQITFSGVGTSDAFTCTSGLNPSLVTTNLVIPVTVTYVGVSSGTVVTQQQTWEGPITLTRLTSPTLTVKPGLGASVTFHHIFLNCGGGGTKPSATFDWVSAFDSPA